MVVPERCGGHNQGEGAVIDRQAGELNECIEDELTAQATLAAGGKRPVPVQHPGQYERGRKREQTGDDRRKVALLHKDPQDRGIGQKAGGPDHAEAADFGQAFAAASGEDSQHRISPSDPAPR